MFVSIPSYPKILFYHPAPLFPVSKVLLLQQLWQGCPSCSAPSLKIAPFSALSLFPFLSAAGALMCWFHKAQPQRLVSLTLYWEYHCYHQIVPFVRVKDGPMGRTTIDVVKKVCHTQNHASFFLRKIKPLENYEVWLFFTPYSNKELLNHTIQYWKQDNEIILSYTASRKINIHFSKKKAHTLWLNHFPFCNLLYGYSKTIRQRCLYQGVY